jgi:molybdopterin synthase sulfur carrier subunit
MINVLFFAQLRETLNSQGVELNIDTPCTVSAIKNALVQHNPNWQTHLNLATVLCAVNQTMVDNQSMIQGGDEVAFFPPVTGG